MKLTDRAMLQEERQLKKETRALLDQLSSGETITECKEDTELLDNLFHENCGDCVFCLPDKKRHWCSNPKRKTNGDIENTDICLPDCPGGSKTAEAIEEDKRRCCGNCYDRAWGGMYHGSYEGWVCAGFGKNKNRPIGYHHKRLAGCPGWKTQQK